MIEGFLAGSAPTTPGGVTFARAFIEEKCREAGLEIVRYEEPADARTDYGGGRPVRLLARKPQGLVASRLAGERLQGPVHFDRQPTPEERAALLACLRKL